MRSIKDRLAQQYDDYVVYTCTVLGRDAPCKSTVDSDSDVDTAWRWFVLPGTEGGGAAGDRTLSVNRSKHFHTAS